MGNFEVLPLCFHFGEGGLEAWKWRTLVLSYWCLLLPMADFQALFGITWKYFLRYSMMPITLLLLLTPAAQACTLPFLLRTLRCASTRRFEPPKCHFTHVKS